MTVRIGVALYQQDDTFISTVAQHLEQMAKEENAGRGIKLNLNMADGRGSQAAQNEQVDRFLAQGIRRDLCEHRGPHGGGRDH